MQRSFAVWLARKNGLPTDLIDDLCQEAALAEHLGQSGENAAERLAKSLGRRESHSDLPADIEARVSVGIDLSDLLAVDDLRFALSVCSGETSRHDGTVSRRFSRIVETARSNSTVSIPSMV